jgi:hypothetical protein
MGALPSWASHEETPQLCKRLMEVQTGSAVRPTRVCLEKQILDLHKQTPGHLCPGRESCSGQSLLRMQGASSLQSSALANVRPQERLRAGCSQLRSPMTLLCCRGGTEFTLLSAGSFVYIISANLH